MITLRQWFYIINRSDLKRRKAGMQQDVWIRGKFLGLLGMVEEDHLGEHHLIAVAVHHLL
jgi:hypothetical protein